MDRCSLHGRAVVLFCKDCQSALCSRCCPPHSSHDLWQLEACEDIAQSLITKTAQALNSYSDQVKALKAQADLQSRWQAQAEARLDAELMKIERDKAAELGNLKRVMEKTQADFYAQTDATFDCLNRVKTDIETAMHQREVYQSHIDALKAKVQTRKNLREVFKEIKQLQAQVLSDVPQVPRITLPKPDFVLPPPPPENWSLEEMRLYGLDAKPSC